MDFELFIQSIPLIVVVVIDAVLLKVISNRHVNSKENFVLIFLFVLLNVLFYGMRDYSIHVMHNDTYAYANMFSEASKYNFLDYLNVQGTKEFVFYGSLWSLSKLGLSFTHYLIFYYFIITLVSVFAVYLLNIKVNTFSMFYFSINLALSTCLARNCLAYAIAWVGILFFLNNKYLKSLLFLILASFIHSSCLIVVVLFGLYWLIKKFRDIRIVLAITITAFIVFYLFADNFIAFIATYDEKIEYYTTFNATFAVGTFVIKIMLLLILIGMKNRKIITKKQFEVELIVILLSFFVLFMQPKLSIMYRVHNYFDIFNALIISQWMSLGKKHYSFYGDIGVVAMNAMSITIMLYYFIYFVMFSIKGYGLAPMYW